MDTSNVAAPLWLRNARKHIGLKETPGKETTPQIRQWLIDLGAWWRDDETPWCGVAVATWMKSANVAVPKHYYRALAWAEWGQRLQGPEVGAVVIFARKGGGHVGIIDGVDQFGRLMVIGGNQGNEVSIAPFEWNRVVGYRWPLEYAVIAPPLEMVVSNREASTNEA